MSQANGATMSESSDDFIINNIDDIQQNDNLDQITFEWEYQMRRQMQQIVPGLFLGPYAAALKNNELQLAQEGITHIICVRQDIESHLIKPNLPEKCVYLVLNIADLPTQNIIQFFSQVKEFIDNCLCAGGKVLVHGNAGISRSAALVIAYIMEKLNMTSSDALRFVQRKRFCIFPNEGFRRQLMEYEPILQARGCPHDARGGIKRPFSDDDPEPFDANQMETCQC